MVDEDRELFERALDASAPEVTVPASFADDTAERALAALGAARAPAASAPGRPVLSRRAVRGALAAAAALLLGTGAAYAYAERRVEGTLVAPPDASAPVAADVGGRATLVLEPGSRARFAAGGLFTGEPDVVRLERGTAFLRVERGGPFEVRTPHGTIRVTGTCFHVALRDDHERERAMTEASKGRFRWFGAGALSAALVVVVYEGGVHVANARGQDEVAVAPGEAATVSAAGEVGRLDPTGEAGPPVATGRAQPGATAGTAATPGTTPATPSALRILGSDEVVRLRDILARHRISPETGERVGELRPGIEDSGNTDLTPEEWVTLAQRGELRWRLPGSASGEIRSQAADAIAITTDESRRVQAVIREAHERLYREVSVLYHEAVGEAPRGGMALGAMTVEITDKTAEEDAAVIRWNLAQERAGLRASPPIAPEMLPYERMMRLMIAFERDLERALAAVLGPERAHELVFGERQMSAHAFGMMGRPPRD